MKITEVKDQQRTHRLQTSPNKLLWLVCWFPVPIRPLLHNRALRHLKQFDAGVTYVQQSIRSRVGEKGKVEKRERASPSREKKAEVWIYLSLNS